MFFITNNLLISNHFIIFAVKMGLDEPTNFYYCRCAEEVQQDDKV